MSYYLDYAKGLEARGEKEAARIIRELYANKVELEKLVKRTSDARDLLLNAAGATSGNDVEAFELKQEDVK